MIREPITILGISPGTKYLGIAVLRGPELRDWRVKAFKGRWSEGKLGKIEAVLASLVARYDPDILAVKASIPREAPPPSIRY